MPSFDVVSKVDEHELANAIDQANREIDNRFDFKGTGAKFVLNKLMIVLTAPTDFQLKQMVDILQNKMAKRNLDLRSLEFEKPTISLHEAKQEVKVKQGIDKEVAKKVTKVIKEQDLKVQASIQGDQIRVTGKKRDDLQEVIAFLRSQKLELPLQFENFRD
ncbi:MAG: YajQ family cyclic di-GMP-binding protein [Gammaproteobacteria bacterium RIFCSPHIGHO2_12_FULL_35_23]|nr:MAG: YajQ family cyclic di-GMP-binding protein [Gammaproteobacteria bacterium RIFCSPHIGHO2_12_FULL_35_23]